MRRFHLLPDAFPALLGPGAVLLESARPDPRERTSLLFREPEAVLALEPGDDPRPLLAEAEAQRSRGRWIAGFLAFEAGYPLVGVPDPPDPGHPTAWLGVYGPPERFDHATGRSSLPDARPRDPDAPLPPAPPLALRPLASERDARGAIERVRAWLAAGDAYQVNLTSALEGELASVDDLLPLWRRALRAQPVSYAAWLHPTWEGGAMRVASVSPELFLRAAPGRIETRPMKGTAPRGRDADEDAALAAALAADPKSRAENVMIVDLLRNDLGRIAEVGSVEVPALFEVERYRGLLQMTSTVAARPRSTRLDETLPAMFPCGSITGAPKRRAMEIIRELEPLPRGVYTGAIGYAAPDGTAAFSVAIRTLAALEPPPGRPARARLGIGSGIVIDSDPAAEVEEWRLKARFLTDPPPDPDPFETLRLEPSGPVRADAHLARLARTAAWLGRPFDPSEARARLAAAARGAPGPLRARLRLRRDGSLDLRVAPFEPGPRTGLRVALARERVRSDDPLRRHKTTARELHDAASRRAAELDLADVLFLDERGRVAEGAISTVLVRSGGRLLTPPAAHGALPGVLRAELLASGEAEEAELREVDLRRADAVLLASSLRGVREARLEPGEIRVFEGGAGSGPALPRGGGQEGGGASAGVAGGVAPDDRFER